MTPPLNGTTHINLTVTDVEESSAWYCSVLGMIIVNDVTPPESGFRFQTLVHPASFASVVLGQPVVADDVSRFDERRVGLHHLAFHVENRGELHEWVEHLDAQGVEHSEVIESAHEAGAQIWFHDPDGIWLEIYWMNRSFFADRLRQRWRERTGAEGGRRRLGSA